MECAVKFGVFLKVLYTIKGMFLNALRIVNNKNVKAEPIQTPYKGETKETPSTVRPHIAQYTIKKDSIVKPHIAQYTIKKDSIPQQILKNTIQPATAIDVNDPYLKLYKSFLAVYSFSEEDFKNPKTEFRYFCYRYLSYIRSFPIPSICTKSKKEAVIVEYRIFPHIEFTIRNAILKLGQTWSHTVICGTKNAEFMKMMCASIHPNIRVIVTGVEHLLPSAYSAFLSTEQFWNMLHGVKILIYQEDSIIFKSNIDDFLEWDYIGAPWPAGQNDAPILVGNGGFSLRTRKVMLDVIATIPIDKMTPNSSTAGYMTATRSTTLPEDVYFTNGIQKYKLGRVAPVEIAKQFSTESIYSPTSLGGHCFWLKDPTWKERLYNNNVVQFRSLTNIITTHRGGFASILQTLKDHEFIDDNGTYDFLPIVEEAYLWNNKSMQPTQAWIGMVHLTPNVPAYLDIVDLDKMMKNTVFQRDIKKCKLLITFSTRITNYMKSLLPSTKIVTMYHPVVSGNIPEFTMQKYVENTNKYIIQIGQQLRRMTSIYKINPKGFKKIWLTGHPDVSVITSKLMLECKETMISIKNSEALMYYTKTFEEYDSFLEKNIVFIDLIDSAANNTVLECILRNTPIILNRTAGAIEYLGKDYPLYFESLADVDGLLTMANIERGHTYLKNLDKSLFTMEAFVKNFAEAVHSI